MTIGLVTDGTCDIPADLAAQHHIHIVPHHVIWGDQTFTDDVNLSAAAFYERLARDPQLPKTAQPSAAEFTAVYQAVREQGADAILCVTTSHKITGAYSSAMLASSMIDVPVRVLDSGRATVALGLTVLAAAEAIERGASMDEAEQVARNAAASSRFYFTLNTLDYLYRGGRIGNAQRLIGSTLNIKPILTIEDGTVASFERARSRKRAVARLIEVAATYTGKHPLRLAVVHSYADEREAFAQTLRDLLAPDQFFESLACSAVGVYAGPGSIGFAIVA